MYQFRLSFDRAQSKEPEDKWHPTNHPYCVEQHVKDSVECRPYCTAHTYTGVGCAHCGRLEEEHSAEFWSCSSKQE